MLLCLTTFRCSWDRQVYVTYRGITKAYDYISRNFLIVSCDGARDAPCHRLCCCAALARITPLPLFLHVQANYESQEAVDNDDGSAYYETFENFMVYSGNGMKNDYG